MAPSSNRMVARPGVDSTPEGPALSMRSRTSRPMDDRSTTRPSRSGVGVRPVPALEHGRHELANAVDARRTASLSAPPARSPSMRSASASRSRASGGRAGSDSDRRTDGGSGPCSRIAPADRGADLPAHVPADRRLLDGGGRGTREGGVVEQPRERPHPEVGEQQQRHRQEDRGAERQGSQRAHIANHAMRGGTAEGHAR